MRNMFALGRIGSLTDTPKVRPMALGWGGVALFLPLLAFLTGCPQPVQQAPDDSNLTSPFLDRDGNFNFSTATFVEVDTDSFVFEGEITDGGDTDLFELGSIGAGDALEIDIQRTSGNLDAVAAVFDDGENLQAYNDDRTPDASNRNPFIELVTSGTNASRYFLGIVGFPGSGSRGRYQITITVRRQVGPPPAEGQIVYLDFRGGNGIVVPNVGRFDLETFDASDLGPAYAGQTNGMKDRIESVVRERYRGFNLTVISSDDGPPPADLHSTIYFGGNNARAFAISEQIDSGNLDKSDVAIVFTRSFDGAFSRTPTFEEMAIAVGNTVAHEIGHLLGLVHTADCGELMDATCGNDRILEQQDFGRAMLDDFVFPVGAQDADAILGWLLGFVGG